MRKARWVGVVLALLLAVAVVSPAAASDCVYYEQFIACVFDWGCLYATGYQWWSYTYCVHPDGTLTLVQKTEYAGCCTP